MYNHYIPASNGQFQRKTIDQVSEPTPRSAPTSEPCSPSTQPQPAEQNAGLELGDLLLLCILLLLLLDSQEDVSTLLITAAAFLFLQ